MGGLDAHHVRCSSADATQKAAFDAMGMRRDAGLPNQHLRNGCTQLGLFRKNRFQAAMRRTSDKQGVHQIALWLRSGLCAPFAGSSSLGIVSVQRNSIRNRG
jgi:hypothetical protein